MTASTLSNSTRQLEKRLGVRLLNRMTRSVSLTGAGVCLLDKLRPIPRHRIPAEIINRAVGCTTYSASLATSRLVLADGRRRLGWPPVSIPELNSIGHAIDMRFSFGWPLLFSGLEGIASDLCPHRPSVGRRYR